MSALHIMGLEQVTPRPKPLVEFPSQMSEAVVSVDETVMTTPFAAYSVEGKVVPATGVEPSARVLKLRTVASLNWVRNDDFCAVVYTVCVVARLVQATSPWKSTVRLLWPLGLSTSVT